MTMAILALLAWKAVKHFGGSQPGAAPKTGATPADAEHRQCRRCPGGGGLSDLMKGGFGGLLAGGAAGSMLRGGLGDLLKQLQEGGQGEVANSWVGKGPNKADRARRSRQRARRRPDRSHRLAERPVARRTAAGLSQYLPDVIDQLTPDGRLPNENELSRRI